MLSQTQQRGPPVTARTLTATYRRTAHKPQSSSSLWRSSIQRARGQRTRIAPGLFRLRLRRLSEHPQSLSCPGVVNREAAFQMQPRTRRTENPYWPCRRPQSSALQALQEEHSDCLPVVVAQADSQQLSFRRAFELWLLLILQWIFIREVERPAFQNDLVECWVSESAGACARENKARTRCIV